MEHKLNKLNVSADRMNHSLIDIVVRKSLQQSSFSTQQDIDKLDRLRSLWIENLELATGSQNQNKANQKRKLGENTFLSSFLTEHVNPLGLVHGLTGIPAATMDVPLTMSTAKVISTSKRRNNKLGGVPVIAAIPSERNQEDVNITTIPPYDGQSLDLILGTKVQVRLHSLLTLGGGVLFPVHTAAAADDDEQSDQWVPARIVQIHKGGGKKKSNRSPANLAIAIRVRLSVVSGVCCGGEVDTTWPSEYIRIHNSTTDIPIAEDNRISSISSSVSHNHPSAVSIEDQTCCNNSSTPQVESNFPSVTPFSSGSSTLDALELLLMDEDEGAGDKSFDQMLRHSGGGATFDPLGVEDDLDLLDLLGDADSDEDDDGDDDLLRVLMDRGNDQPVVSPTKAQNISIPRDDETELLALLATGEKVSLKQLEEAERYATDMLLHRPQFDLVPLQTSGTDLRSGGVRRSFTGHFVPVSTPTSEVDLSTVRLSSEEDPARHVVPDITVTGRLRKISRVRQHYQFTLYDVYIREVFPTGDNHHIGSSRDYIVPVMQVRLDGRELFAATEDDLLVHRRKAIGSSSR